MPLNSPFRGKGKKPAPQPQPEIIEVSEVISVEPTADNETPIKKPYCPDASEEKCSGCKALEGESPCPGPPPLPVSGDIGHYTVECFVDGELAGMFSVPKGKHQQLVVYDNELSKTVIKIDVPTDGSQIVHTDKQKK